MSNFSDLNNLYDILGISSRASHESLRQAYRDLARRHHPDVNNDPKAHELMAKINAAFEILIDPVRRSEYDQSMNDQDIIDPVPKYTVNKSKLNIKLLYRLVQHKTPVYGLSFMPESRKMISSSFDNELLFWNLDEGVVYHRSKLESGVVNRIVGLDSHTYVATGCSETTISGWFSKSKNTSSWRNNIHEWICSTEISSDGRYLAYGTMEGKVVIADLASGNVLQSWSAKQDSITSLSWSYDNRILATGGANASVKLWRVSSGRELFHFNNVRSTVCSMAFSRTTKQLAVASIDKAVRVFSLSDLGQVKVLFGHEMPIEDLHFHPNSKVLASTGRDGTVRLWDIADGTGHSFIEASHQALNRVQFSPDGTKMVAAGLDKVIRVWDVSMNNKPRI